MLAFFSFGGGFFVDSMLFCFVLSFPFSFSFFFLIFFILNLVLIGLKFGGRTYVLMTCHNRTFVQLN